MSIQAAAPPPFRTEDFARRMARAADQASEAGLAGLLITPGPDLVYFTGYAPMVIAERITILVIDVSREPAMIVPTLDRAGAEEAPGAAAITLSGWEDG